MLRRLHLKLFLASGLALLVSALWQLRTNSLLTMHASAFLRDQFGQITEGELIELDAAEGEVRRRAQLYNEAISSSFLDHGMVVNLDRKGHAIDACDSLLFSSLRFVALSKLGSDEHAAAAWQAITASQVDGKWLRHPTCTASTSRDMIIGLLAALTQKPAGYRQHLLALMRYLEENAGYVGDGPFYVSYLSPGLAEILRHFARIERLPEESLPAVVRYGFSTMELDTYLSSIGFESHLIAMVLWIELELLRLEERSGLSREGVRALPIPLERLTRAIWGVKVSNQRLAWLAQRLVDRDPANLYFRLLRLQTADALTAKARLTMLRELIDMPQFPANRLPSSCDRRADYLWQRASREYQARGTAACERHFAGVDFLWITALLAPVRVDNVVKTGLVADGELPLPAVH